MREHSTILGTLIHRWSSRCHIDPVLQDCLGMFYEIARLKWGIYSLAEGFERVAKLKLLYWESIALKDG